MSNDPEFEAAVREYLAGATRALDRKDAASASIELVQALQYSFAIVHRGSGSDPTGYRHAWERVAYELSMLPPSLIRRTVQILDDRG